MKAPSHGVALLAGGALACGSLVLLDAISRVLARTGSASLGWDGLAVALGASVGVGLCLGAIALGLLRAWSAPGAAAERVRALVTGGVSLRPLPLLLGLVAALVPMLAAAVLRARALRAVVRRDASPVAALADGLLLASAVVVFVLVARRAARLRWSQHALGAGAASRLAVGVGIAVVLAATPLRGTLRTSSLWDLVLAGALPLLVAGFTGLARGWRAPRGIVVVTAAIGLVCWFGLSASASLRARVLPDLRPPHWIERLAFTWDRDGDGFSPLLGGGDCDDKDPQINPDAPELAGNGRDENCRGGDRPARFPWRPRRPYVPLPEGRAPVRSVLILSIDTLRPDHLGAFGYRRRTSPNLDALAARSTIFERAYSAAPSTMIAMPVIATGRNIAELSWDRSVYPYRLSPSIRTMAEVASKAGLRTVAVISHHFQKPQHGYVRGFGEVDQSAMFEEENYRKKETAARVVDRTVQLLEHHRGERMLLWAHFMDPHGSYIEHPGYPSFGSRPVDLYDGEIAYTDAEIGRLLGALDRLGIADETAIVVTADHGEHVGEPGFRGGHADDLSEATLRIPILVSVPGTSPRRNSCVVSLTDLAPTVLNLLGLDGGAAGMTGASLVPEVFDGVCDRSREIVTELKFSMRNQENLRALVGGRYKLVEDVQRGTVELFDLRSGGREGVRVTADKRSVASRMRQRLRDWAEAVGSREVAALLRDHVVDELPARAHPIRGARFRGGVEIVGANLGRARVAAGEALTVEVFLRVTRVQRGALTIRYDWPRRAVHWFPNRHLPGDLLGSIYWPRGKIVIDDPRLHREYVRERGRKLPVRVGLERAGRPVRLVSGGEWAQVGVVDVVRWSKKGRR